MMPVIGVPRERLERITEPTNTLRTGQIVQGKILKIYPNHRAQLQIGSQQMIAQLEAPLAVGERYHFQVANTENMIELKVIGTNLKSSPTATENVVQLLNQLNIQGTRTVLPFVQTLINEKTPFTKQQLQQAIQLLQRTNNLNNPEHVQRVLMEMLGRNLPMTQSVFNALYVRSMTSATNEFSDLLNTLQNSQSHQINNDVHGKLIGKLSQMLETKSTEQNSLLNMLSQNAPKMNSDEIVNNLLQNKRSVMTNIQQLLSNLPQNITQFTTYNIERAKIAINQMPIPQEIKQMLTTMLTNNRAQFMNVIQSLAKESTFNQLQSSINSSTPQQQFLSHINQFMMMSGLSYENTVQNTVLHEQGQRIDTVLNQLLAQSNSIQHVANSLVEKWSPTFTSDTTHRANDTLAMFKRDIEEQLVRLLPQNQRQALVNLLQQNDSSDRVWQFVQTLSKTDVFEQIENLLMNIKDSRQPISTNMFNHMPDVKQMLQSLLISQEVTVNQQASEQLQQTIKGLLLQLVQQNDPTLGDRAQQVLHFINGLQLNSVHETSHFIQASIQVPGEQIGLNGDLFMDFESQKTEDGKINADYCRILFFLNLNALDETVIDMNVQKRLVTITIYNEHRHLETLARSLYVPLKKGLEKLDYQLSTVRFKPLYEQGKQESAQSNIYNSEGDQQGGVDFRV